jgi:hypothetical protein
VQLQRLTLRGLADEQQERDEESRRLKEALKNATIIEVIEKVGSEHEKGKRGHQEIPEARRRVQQCDHSVHPDTKKTWSLS